MYKNILFDLDGTLTDPGLGITNSIMYALRKMDKEVMEREALYKFIGPPLMDSFQKYCGLSEEESERAIKYYREYFKQYGLYENEVYAGVEKMLKVLKDRQKKLIVATSKPEQFAIEILQHFHLYECFDFVAGATMDAIRYKKADVISYALENCEISDLSSVIMIGDREHDIIGAKQNGIDSIGVLYGYGSLEELENAGAMHIVEKPDEIADVIEGK